MTVGLTEVPLRSERQRVASFRKQTQAVYRPRGTRGASWAGCRTSTRTLTCSLALCPQVTYGSFDYTSLLYLSDYLDDFGGGRFVFVEEGANKTVEPRAGRTLRRQPRACGQVGKWSICWSSTCPTAPGHCCHCTAVPRAPLSLRCVPTLSLPRGKIPDLIMLVTALSTGTSSPDQVVLEPPGLPTQHGHSELPCERVLRQWTVPSLLALAGKGGVAAPGRTPRDPQAEPCHLVQAPGTVPVPSSCCHVSPVLTTSPSPAHWASVWGVQSDQ